MHLQISNCFSLRYLGTQKSKKVLEVMKAPYLSFVTVQLILVYGGIICHCLMLRCRWLTTKSSHQDGQGAGTKKFPCKLFSVIWSLLITNFKQTNKNKIFASDIFLEDEILDSISNQTCRNVQFQVENYRKIRDETIMLLFVLRFVVVVVVSLFLGGVKGGIYELYKLKVYDL